MFCTIKVWKSLALIGSLFLGFMTCAAADDDQAIHDWQMQMLLEPTPAQLDMEQRKKRVFIYSRIRDSDISRAMDQQFDRIEHMMFVNTLVAKNREPTPKKTNEDESSGPVLVEEDDGCD